jgi:hypothetical protein
MTTRHTAASGTLGPGASDGERSTVRITTTRVIPLAPDEVWPLLCDSRLHLRPLCPVFFLGTPRPHQCALPSGPGAVGAERECRSEQGTVHQRITVWEPPYRLSFHMESTSLGFDAYVDKLTDDFTLSAHRSGTAVTRTTTVLARGWLKPVRYAMVFVGLKSVHRFVFRNWQTRPARAIEPTP